MNNWGAVCFVWTVLNSVVIVMFWYNSLHIIPWSDRKSRLWWSQPCRYLNNFSSKALLVHNVLTFWFVICFVLCFTSVLFEYYLPKMCLAYLSCLSCLNIIWKRSTWHVCHRVGDHFAVLHPNPENFCQKIQSFGSNPDGFCLQENPFYANSWNLRISTRFPVSVPSSVKNCKCFHFYQDLLTQNYHTQYASWP